MRKFFDGNFFDQIMLSSMDEACFHILLPRLYRTTIELSIPVITQRDSESPDEFLEGVIYSALQAQHDNSLIIIGSFSTKTSCVNLKLDDKRIRNKRIRNKRIHEDINDTSNIKRLRHEAINSEEVKKFLQRGQKRKKDSEIAPVDDWENSEMAQVDRSLPWPHSLSAGHEAQAEERDLGRSLDDWENSEMASVDVSASNEIMAHVEQPKQNVIATFFQIPDELILKLKQNGLKKCNFYISKAEDERQVQVLNGRPGDDYFAFTDFQGNPRPYETGVIDL